MNEETNLNEVPKEQESEAEATVISMRKKRGLRVGVRLVVSLVLISAAMIIHFCGVRVDFGEKISSGANTVGVVQYIVSKYNALTGR